MNTTEANGMKFIATDLGEALHTQLNMVSKVRVAVAYFNPEDTTLAALSKLSNLELVISDDFQINNPYKLESLLGCGVVHAIPADAEVGKLHAKVFIIVRNDGSRWAMIGSANLTRP